MHQFTISFLIKTQQSLSSQVCFPVGKHIQHGCWKVHVLYLESQNFHLVAQTPDRKCQKHKGGGEGGLGGVVAAPPGGDDM